MPFTPAHVAAALPFRGLAPRYLHMPALIIGTLSPDLPYYWSLKPTMPMSHTPAGSFLICLPAGLLVTALYHLVLGRAAVVLFPGPLRRSWWPVARVYPRWDRRFFLRVGVSVLLGAWTHILWDGMTHKGRWGTDLFPVLVTGIRLAGFHFTGVAFLQHGSTLVGGLLVIVCFIRKSQSLPESPAAPRLSPGVRPAIVGMIVGSAVVGGLLNAGSALRFSTEVLVVRGVIGVTAFGMAALVVWSLVFAWFGNGLIREDRSSSSTIFD